MATTADVIVLGAGAAGLAAARRLGTAGLKVIVVEARDRCGGRVYTRHVPSVPVPIELGAEFIHGRPPEIWRIVSEARAAVYAVTGRHCAVERGRLRAPIELWPSMQKVVRRIAAMRGPDRPFVEVADALWPTPADAEIRARVLSYVEGFNAAHADRISARSVARAEAAGGGGEQAFRWVRGYDHLIAYLSDELAALHVAVRLGTVVEAVRWRRGRVMVATRSRRTDRTSTLTARAAVVALPLGVLQIADDAEGSVRFTPPLPSAGAIASAAAVGDAVRVVLAFREAFWNDGRLRINRGACRMSQLGFVHAPSAELPTWWTTAPIDAPVLTAWAGGRRAEALVARGTDAIAAAAVTSLAEILGVGVRTVERRLEATFTHDWRADPFSRGAYSYLRAGGHAAVRRLSRPIEGTLFLAGEALADDANRGTVHGALASGDRAARALLGALRK